MSKELRKEDESRIKESANIGGPEYGLAYRAMKMETLHWYEVEAKLNRETEQYKIGLGIIVKNYKDQLTAKSAEVERLKENEAKLKVEIADRTIQLQEAEELISQHWKTITAKSAEVERLKEAYHVENCPSMETCYKESLVLTDLKSSLVKNQTEAVSMMDFAQKAGDVVGYRIWEKLYEVTNQLLNETKP